MQEQVPPVPAQPMFAVQIVAFPDGRVQANPQGQIEEINLHRVFDAAKAGLIQMMSKPKPSLLLPPVNGIG